MENEKKFDNEMFGYDKKQVEEYIREMKADSESTLQAERAEVNRLSNEITIIRKKLERYDQEYISRQEKVANALITAEDQAKNILEAAREEAMKEKHRIEAVIDSEKEKLLEIKKEVIDLKEKTIRILEKYNSDMTELLG